MKIELLPALLAEIETLPVELREPARKAAIAVLTETVRGLIEEPDDERSDAPESENVVTRGNFAVMVAHGHNVIPPGKGPVHHMKPGQKIYLKSKFDSWIANDTEPFNVQVRRVFFDPEYANFREQERVRYAILFMAKSHLYLDRALDWGLEKYLRTFSGFVA